MFFDTHAHLNDEQLINQTDEVIRCAKEAGLVGLADVGYDRPSSICAMEQALKYPDFVAAVTGYHPYDADKINEQSLEELYEWGKKPYVCAIGEIGLDYYRDTVPREVQKKAFAEQIEAAKSLKKPISVHDREAHGDTMQILKEQKAGLNGGIIHCFSGSKEMARECLNMGFDIAFGGSLTFKNAKNLSEVCAYVPLEHLLIETDCPYLTPHPHRGEMNEPTYVALVAAKIAEIKNMTAGEIGEITFKNAVRVYNLKDKYKIK